MEYISTPNAPAAIGPYSQAVKSNGFLFVSGQTGFVPSTGAVADDTIETQAEQVMLNIKAILDEAGVGFEKVVKTTCFLADIEDFAVFNKIYEKYFISKPARSCVAAKDLPKHIRCEVEVIAEL